jgi:hypothetical protein
MRSRPRNRGLVADLATATVRARAGAAYLDETIGPRWDQMIDLDALNIRSQTRCICGQLLRRGYLWPLLMTPRRLVERGFTCEPLTQILIGLRRPSEVARAYDLLTRAWRQVILQRRRPEAEPDSMSQPTRSGSEVPEEMEGSVVESPR